MLEAVRTGSRYWHTIKHLRLQQIAARGLRRFKTPRIDLSAPPDRRMATGTWVSPARRHASMAGPDRFVFLNQENQIANSQDWNNPALPKLWLYNLHYFDDLTAEGADSRADWHRSLIARWIAENPPGRGNGWEAYPTSLRIVNWIKWALAGNALQNDWVDSLAVQARYLSGMLETHLLGNHLFANAKALLVAGLFFDGEEGRRFYQTGREILRRELPEQVLADGGNFELSPMYHAIFLEDLLDLTNVHRVFGRNVDEAVAETLPRMIDWLSAMCHPDGEIGFFNDAALGTTPPVDEILDYACRLGFDRPEHPAGLTELAASGYTRVAFGEAVALIDNAAVGPDYLPGHAHADTLSFELSLFGRRVIVNSGTSVYEGPGRPEQRGTAAHSTVVVDGQDSSEVWGSFRVARRARVFDRESREATDRISVSACHDGYKRLKGRPEHCRKWTFSERELEVSDTISGSGTHSVAVIYHLHPDIAVTTVDDSGVTLEADGHPIAVEFHGGGALSVEGSTYHPQFGLSVASNRIVYRLSGELPKDFKARVVW